MDNKQITEQTDFNFNKTVDSYNDDVKNYIIPRELTVTITLAEYRELIQKQIKAERDDAERKYWDKYHEVDALRQENEKLKAAIEMLQCGPCNVAEEE